MQYSISNTFEPRHSRFKKFLSISLVLGMLQFGTAVPAYGNKVKKETVSEVVRARAAASLVTFNGQQVKVPTPEDMYREFYKKGVDAASEKRGKDKAVQHFTKAIKYLQQAYSDKRFFDTLVEDGNKLEDKTKKLFNKAVSGVLVKKAIKEYNLEEKLDMKKGLSTGAVVGLVSAAALAAYGAYELFIKKKPVEEEEKDYPTTVTIRAINHTKRVIGTYTIPNVMTSSTLNLSISEIKQKLGIPDNEVDPELFAVRGPTNWSSPEIVDTPKSLT